jgi:hypothetical protein
VTLDAKLPPTRLLSRDPPSVSANNLLAPDEEELIRKGFPAQMRFQLALWPASGLAGNPVSRADWRVIVDFEPLEKIFRVVRLSQDGYQSLGSYTKFSDVSQLVARPYQPRIRAPTTSGRYYYTVTLEVERMTENDLAEMRSWLGTGTGRSRSSASVVVGFLGSLVKRMIGAQKKVYHGRSEIFEVS